MSRVAYVNGRYRAQHRAVIPIEDRGYLFADGVYEVIAIRGGRQVDGPAHMERLRRSLGELRIAMPMTERALTAVLDETVRRNRVAHGIVYLQITRGVARRDHAFPTDPRVRPSVVVTARTTAPVPQALREGGVGVVSVPDIRWGRCDIKSVALLPNVLAKQAAREQGAFEAWQYDDQQRITEGASTNAWIVTAEGTLVTHPVAPRILNGITRIRLLELARAAGHKVEERPFTLAEALSAREAFLSSTSSFVLPVVRIDGRPIGNGHPGMVSQDLRQRYDAFANSAAAATGAAVEV